MFCFNQKLKDKGRNVREMRTERPGPARKEAGLIHTFIIQVIDTAEKGEDRRQ